MTARQTSRRGFLKQSLFTGGLLSFSAVSWNRVYGSNDRLRVASVGPGGKGWSDLTGVAASAKVEVSALCDIDEGPQFLGRAAEKYPSAKRFFDYRRLLDEPGLFDAVIVSTPDHMHAPVALPAMHLRKHVFCQKPLTHTVHEARQMRQAAEKFKVVTQMGNQIQSHQFYRTAVKLVHDGVIGKVKAVHAWQSGRMGWILVDDRPAGMDPVPAGVHWNEWLGVAPERPFKEKIYHSFNWRAWQDFSNGQLGDFGCHILDPVFNALKLTAPTKVVAEAPAINREVWTKQATVRFEFPATELTVAGSIPVTWYDGEGRKPSAQDHGLPATVALPGSGSVLIGEKGTLVIPHVAAPQLYPEEKFRDFTIELQPARDHYVSWADACRGEGEATSNFGYSGPLTETVLLGTIAIRLPGQALKWDAAAGELSGHDKASSLLTKSYRREFEPAWL